MGVNGVAEIKAHPFFKGINWNNIRTQPAPNIPNVTSKVDTSNFDKFDEIILVHQACGIVHVDVPFVSVFIGWDVIADRHPP